MPTALLIIDVQQGLFAPSPRPDDADRIVTRINQLSAAARLAGAQVIFVQHEDSTLVPDTPAWALADGLHIDPRDRHIRKAASDAFQGTALSALLDTLGVNGLVVCGYASEFCVDSTVRRAAALGYEVTVAADGHTTHDKPHASAAQIRHHHNTTLSNIGSYGVAIEAQPCADIAFR